MLFRALSRLFSWKITFLLLVTGLAVPLLAQIEATGSVGQRAANQFETAALKTTTLGDGIFLFSGDGGNVVAIVGEGDTLLIDSGIYSRTDELSDAVYKMTHRPVTRLVNTHWHFDRTGGNTAFGLEGVMIIAQENVRKSLQSVHVVPFVGLSDGHYPKYALPTEIYRKSLVLHQGSENLKLVNYGSAHTNGDTIIYLSPANVVVTGDIFSNPYYPVIDLSAGGSVDGLINAVDRVLENTNDKTRIVPGHGPLAARSDLQKYRDMLVTVRERIRRLIAAGRTMEEATANVPTADFDRKWGTGYLTGKEFTEMVYTSLSSLEATSVTPPVLTK